MTTYRSPDAPNEPTHRLTNEQAVELAGYLSALARAGLPMAPGVRAMAHDLPSGKLPAALDALAARLESGQSLEDAIAALGSRLPAHVCELMIAGARSGRLSQTLDDLLTHERATADMGRRLWQVVAYPAMLLAFLVVWLLVIAMWLIPQMELTTILEGMDDMYGWNSAQTPLAPNHSARLVEFARVAPPLMLVAFCGVVLTVGAARAIGGKPLVSRLMMQVPLVGPALWYRSLVEFCGLLVVFLKEQLPLGEALRLTSQAARDAAIRAAAAKAANEAIAGRGLAECLVGQSLFPATMINVVEWGERHSALADALESAQRMYRDRFEQQLRLIRLVVPPMIFLLVGGSALLVACGWLGVITSTLRLLMYW